MKIKNEVVFLNYIKRIYNTESRHIFYQELKKDVASIATEVEIIFGGG